MDGVTLQARIYAGMGKDAQHTGRLHNIYRPASPLLPLDYGNRVGEIYCRFAAEKRFEVPHKYKEPTYFLYADGRELEKGDFLVSDTETFFIADKQPLLPMQAVRCNDLVNIDRVAYSGTVLSTEPVATAYPIFRQLKKLDQKPVNATFGVSTSATPIAEWFVYLPIDWTVIRQGDIVTDQTGREYTIGSIDPTEIGAVVVMRQSDHEQGDQV
jgi:hypothetical protein